MNTSLSLIIRALLLFCSFSGLCAFFRVHFQIDQMIAPIASASFIIVILMLSGMLGLLKAATWALYIAGFAAFILYYAIQRTPPSLHLWIAALLFVIFLAWRFFPCYIRHSDDFSNWGLVARHLLRYDRFPNAGDAYVSFQSYPLGSACFIYYIARFIGDAEGIYLIAQNFLLGVLFLPTFSLVQRHKKALYPALFAVFLIYFGYSCRSSNLLVDIMQTFWGIGMAASVMRYRNDFRRACFAAIPAMIATAYIKSSGIFFSLCTGLMLMQVSRRVGKSDRRVVRFAPIGASILGYAIWMLYIRLRFPSAATTKHAVSLLNYARVLHRKGISGCLEVTRGMFAYFFHMRSNQNASLLIALCCLLVLLYCARRLRPERGRRYLRACMACVGSYLTWFLMLYFMYLFSMPGDEALNLAGIERYDATGLSYSACLVFLLAILALDCTDFAAKGMRLVPAVCGALISVASLALLALPVQANLLSSYFVYTTAYNEARVALQNFRSAVNPPPNSRFIVFVAEDHSSIIFRIAKFELESPNVLCISDESDDPDSFLFIRSGLQPIADIHAYLSEYIDLADWVVIVDESPEFEAQLAALDTSTPVYRAYATASTS